MKKIEIDKEWCIAAAQREGDSEVGAGVLAIDPVLEPLEPHPYVPSTLHMGDCIVCGNLQGSPIHSPFRRRGVGE